MHRRGLGRRRLPCFVSVLTPRVTHAVLCVPAVCVTLGYSAVVAIGRVVPGPFAEAGQVRYLPAAARGAVTDAMKANRSAADVLGAAAGGSTASDLLLTPTSASRRSRTATFDSTRGRPLGGFFRSAAFVAVHSPRSSTSRPAPRSPPSRDADVRPIRLPLRRRVRARGPAVAGASQPPPPSKARSPDRPSAPPFLSVGRTDGRRSCRAPDATAQDELVRRVDASSPTELTEAGEVRPHRGRWRHASTRSLPTSASSAHAIEAARADRGRSSRVRSTVFRGVPFSLVKYLSIPMSWRARATGCAARKDAVYLAPEHRHLARRWQEAELIILGLPATPDLGSCPLPEPDADGRRGTPVHLRARPACRAAGPLAACRERDFPAAHASDCRLLDPHPGLVLGLVGLKTSRGRDLGPCPAAA